MADETNNEKVKTTVPALERTARGVADHAAAVQARQYDAERKVFRDPIVATLALFTYAKLTAALLHEAEERLTQDRMQLELRTAALETRITAIETWKLETEKQAAVMAADLESMMTSDPEELIKNMRTNLAALHDKPALPSTPPTIIDVASSVVPIKSEKTTDKKREREEKK